MARKFKYSAKVSGHDFEITLKSDANTMDDIKEKIINLPFEPIYVMIYENGAKIKEVERKPKVVKEPKAKVEKPKAIKEAKPTKAVKEPKAKVEKPKATKPVKKTKPTSVKKATSTNTKKSKPAGKKN